MNKITKSLLPLFISILIITVSSVSSSRNVWIADFSNNDLSGWTINDGSFRLDEGYLNASSSSSSISHGNSVAYGKWSFDLYLPNPESRLQMSFISDDISIDKQGYELIFENVPFEENSTFAELIVDGSISYPLLIDETFTNEKMTGWQYIVVERSISGDFNIRVNGQVVLSGSNNVVKSSSSLEIVMTEGVSIDNLSIREHIEPAPYNTAYVEFNQALEDNNPSNTDLGNLAILILVSVGVSFILLPLFMVNYLKLKKTPTNTITD